MESNEEKNKIHNEKQRLRYPENKDKILQRQREKHYEKKPKIYQRRNLEEYQKITLLTTITKA